MLYPLIPFGTPAIDLPRNVRKMGVSASLLPCLHLSVMFLFLLPWSDAARLSSVLFQDQSNDCLLRASFPANFMWGAASSAYQYEGATLEDGKGMNSWDFFTHQSPESIADGSNADVAADEYHRFVDDIKLMASLGVNSYRFSISWSRILPDGRGTVNHAGIRYYNRVIDTILQHGITPIATLFHFDLPQALQSAYHGWLSPQIIEDFRAFAEICFKEYGDRVKHWITINEPNLFVPMGYVAGTYPPARCSITGVGKCVGGFSNSTDAYTAAHHVILAHAAAVHTFRTHYQGVNGGVIGVAVNTPWYEPLRDTDRDRAAAERMFTLSVRWFLDPIVFGEYPKPMREELLVPSFEQNQSAKLRKSFDFIGVNYYTAYYASAEPVPQQQTQEHVYPNSHVYVTSHRDGVQIGPNSGISGSNVVPRGLNEALQYLTHLYSRPPILITENGFAEPADSSTNALLDDVRVDFHRDHLEQLSKAMREGADVRGYLVWSLLDNFEWSFGYTIRFGLFSVDPATQERVPKSSATWFRRFLTCSNQTLRMRQ